MSPPPEPTETFRGTYNGKEIVFSHKDFQTYTLSMDGQLTSGSLNTERGYGDDRDATVYVLNSDKPKKEQKYFVRNPQGSVYMLDNGRYVVDDAVFERVVSTKPMAAKTARKTPKAKKQAAANTRASNKDSLKAAAKKPASKKVSKSRKKKKVVKKTRKKSRKKKTSRKSKKQESATSDK